MLPCLFKAFITKVNLASALPPHSDVRMHNVLLLSLGQKKGQLNFALIETSKV